LDERKNPSKQQRTSSSSHYPFSFVRHTLLLYFDSGLLFPALSCFLIWSSPCLSPSPCILTHFHSQTRHSQRCFCCSLCLMFKQESIGDTSFYVFVYSSLVFLGVCGLYTTKSTFGTRPVVCVLLGTMLGARGGRVSGQSLSVFFFITFRLSVTFYPFFVLL
jgi:hypothetical protein